MAQKKHPILTVLVILCVVALFLGITMVIVLKIVAPSSNLSFGDKIGVIHIDGAISQSIDITTELVRLKKDSGIKAIILRINSPGGSVGPTQEIYREVRKTIQTKKVVVSMGSVAASGGYYIAAGADKIVANPGTITGSIGVIMHFVSLEELLNKIGIDLEILKSGEFKDIGSPNRELTEREKELLNALIADIQRQFEEGVAEGRNLPLEKVREIADGRIFSGSRAKELGLVDVLGNFQDAVEIAKNLAGIKGDVTLVYPKKDKMDLWDLVFETAAGSVSKLIQGMKSRVEYRWSGFAQHRVKESY
jgi:protease IV